jgi:hypothetical protein
MTQHWKAGLALALVSVFGVILGMIYSPVIGVVAILWAIVGWFVLGTAWMQPEGYEEHDDPPNTNSDERSDRHAPHHRTHHKPSHDPRLLL